MYARKQVFFAFALLIISIMMLCFIRYSRKEIKEGFGIASFPPTMLYETGWSRKGILGIFKKTSDQSGPNTMLFSSPDHYVLVLHEFDSENIDMKRTVDRLKNICFPSGNRAKTLLFIFSDGGTNFDTYSVDSISNLSTDSYDGQSSINILGGSAKFYKFRLNKVGPLIDGTIKSGNMNALRYQNDINVFTISYLYTNDCVVTEYVDTGCKSSSGITCEPSDTSKSGISSKQRIRIPEFGDGQCSSFLSDAPLNTSSVQCSLERCPPPKCPAGQRLNGSSCEDCPSGTYQDQADFTGNTCKAIPPTNVASSSSSSVTCATGYTLSSEGTRCEPNPCTAGTNYNIETGKSPCTNCPPNSACTTRGFTCLPNYMLSGNTCISEICGIGSYSSNGIYPCTPCSTDYTTTITGAKNETDCKRKLSVQDILKQLNYSPTNTSGKFYGLTAANINVSTDQTIIQGQTIDYTSYITPLSLVEQSEINYNNQTSFNLTFPNGRAVNKEGIFPAIIQNLPPSTSGSIKNINDAANCSGFTADTCTISYNTPSGGEKITTNPCPALNAWYDFDKGFCVNKNGSRVTTPFICPPSSIYNKEVNDCIAVRSPFFKNQPPKTTGTATSSDITNCLTVDGADCQPLYQLGTSKTTTNPCTGTTVYDFGRRSCTNTVRQTRESSCCSMGAEAASRSQPCLGFIHTVPVKNTSKCRTRPNICCNSQSYSTNRSCLNNDYWQMQKSFKPGTCPIAGFADMAEDTMQTKRIKWAEKRQLLNVP